MGARARATYWVNRAVAPLDAELRSQGFALGEMPVLQRLALARAGMTADGRAMAGVGGEERAAVVTSRCGRVLASGQRISAVPWLSTLRAGTRPRHGGGAPGIAAVARRG